MMATSVMYRINTSLHQSVTKLAKVIPVTGRGTPQDCESSRLPHFLENRLKDGGKVDGLTGRPSFTPQEDCWC
jgi:hypothetical protein